MYLPGSSTSFTGSSPLYVTLLNYILLLFYWTAFLFASSLSAEKYILWLNFRQFFVIKIKLLWHVNMLYSVYFNVVQEDDLMTMSGNHLIFHLSPDSVNLPLNIEQHHGSIIGQMSHCRWLSNLTTKTNKKNNIQLSHLSRKQPENQLLQLIFSFRSLTTTITGHE